VERLKTELVSMVAHELKSPLTSIYGFSELLLKSELKNEKAKEYSRIILNESSRLTDLINKFLDLSKLESGATEPRLVSFDIQESIQRMLDSHGPQASRKKIHVIFDVARSIPNVLGDPDLLDQVLLNVFSNAVKYSPPGSKVGIEVKSEGRFVTVQMIDNGQGISKQDLPKIFNKFFRAAESGDGNKQNGSGLGLALVKEIIEKLGGKVHVKSQRGVGSIFSFSLPQAVA
jgi:two-component system phosphate regulon sensor histidine kinase PhoR